MQYKSHFLERYKAYLSALELSTLIHDLEMAYEQTHNEIIYHWWQFFSGKQQAARETEIQWNERDFEEILNNPQLYAESVRSWAFLYRDKENQ